MPVEPVCEHGPYQSAAIASPYPSFVGMPTPGAAHLAIKILPTGSRIALSTDMGSLKTANVLAICLWGGLALADKVNDFYTLTVVVQGVRNSEGVIGVLVFESARGWPEDTSAALLRAAVPAQEGSTTVLIPNVPSGDYGVVVLHDENRNMRLDRNWFGLPREQWGMSNNPPEHSSAPGFKRARFSLRGDTQLLIHLR